MKLGIGEEPGGREVPGSRQAFVHSDCLLVLSFTCSMGYHFLISTEIQVADLLSLWFHLRQAHHQASVVPQHGRSKGHAFLPSNPFTCHLPFSPE